MEATMEMTSVVHEDLKSKIDEVLKNLCAKQKFERDGALKKFDSNLKEYDEESMKYIISRVLTLLTSSKEQWETYHGVLSAANVMVVSNLPIMLLHENQRLIEKCCMKLIVHDEVRVRESAGELLGNFCQINEGYTYKYCGKGVLDIIKANLERDLHQDSELRKNAYCSEGMTKLQIFHDTAGWKNLETSMKCLQHMIRGCGKNFQSNKELLDLLFSALLHTNRFVRETSLTVCGTLAECNTSEKDGNATEKYGEEFSNNLAKGLADNWSQVRLAASVATRKFLLSMPIERRQSYFPSLLPRICLNRYYVAEGVRLYSQQSWELVTEREGAKYVEEHLEHVVTYYIASTKADNHAVREAACAAIAEIGKKLSPSIVGDYVNPLVLALIDCFKDDSWPVRDAACLACALFVRSNSSKCAEYLSILYPLFFKNLQDSIPSVREGAASAINSLLEQYKNTGFDDVSSYINEALEGLKDQPADCEKYGNLDTGPALYGVAKQKKDNDIKLHSDNLLYSCGSLAPKMGRGGCSDCKFQRPSQPWEKLDGCIHLIGFIAESGHYLDYIDAVLPKLAIACTMKHYSSHLNLLETLCKCFVRISKGLGKTRLKRHLESFYDIFFYALRSENALTSTAASFCLNDIATKIGPSILKARLEQYNPTYLHEFERFSGQQPIF